MLVLAAFALLVVVVPAGAVTDGELDGNGHPYVGLMVAQDAKGNPLENPTKGEPAHAQTWGLIPKAERDFLTSIGVNPGNACNPIRAAENPPEEPAQ